MASVTYSFIDIAVLDEVRTRFVAGDALVILSVDLDEILWANGPGAALLGYADIEAAIGAGPGLSIPTRRQISATPGYPDIGHEKTINTRLGRGLSAPLASFRASSIRLPDGEKALLLGLSAPQEKMGDEKIRWKAAIKGFNEAEQFAALVDHTGAIAAASTRFDELGIAPETLAELARQVRNEGDRLIKRLIPGADGDFPAGFARLTDEPAMHLLVVVGEPQSAVADTTDEASQTSEPSAPESENTPPASDTKESQPETAAKPASSIRFAWHTDAESRFTALSDVFSEAVGSAAADVIGRRFRDVSNAFGLDPEGRISTLLERRDTWSGRTVLWPIAGTDKKVPVDLAALPIYGRGRVFEGFHGFGIARMGDATTDPEAIGLVLTPEAQIPEGKAIYADAATLHGFTERDDSNDQHGLNGEHREEDPAGETPPLSIAETPGRRHSDKIIRLEEHRAGVKENGPESEAGEQAKDDNEPRQKESGLSLSEQSAFRAIGDRLRLENTGEAGTASHPKEADQPAKASSAVDAPLEPSPTEEEPARVREKAVADTENNAAETESGGGASVHSIEMDGAVLANLPLPILVHSGDILHYANRAFLELTGHDSLSALERAGGLGSLFAAPYEDDEEETPPPSERNLRLRTADDDEFDVMAHLQSIPWGDGKALLLALKRAEPEADQPAPEAETPLLAATRETPAQAGELQMHLAEMRAIIDTATDGVAIIANDGTVRSTNSPADALFGFDSDDVVGKPFTALFAIESRGAVQEYLDGLSDHGVASVLNDGREVIGREAQGRFIPLFITIGRLPNETGYCAVLRDITQWKRAEEELTQARAEAERASSQKTEFLARVSHEIRTPLNAIIGFSELIIDEKFGPVGNHRYRDYLRDINRSGNHVLDLVNDLLDISKIEAGQQDMQYEAVALNETLSQTVAMMQPQANRERVIIRSSLASNLPEVVADARSIRQIALNLLSNAIRYTPAGGQVIVSTAYSNDGAVLMRVRDTGVGMSSAELDEALKPFKQVSALRHKRGDGTGLGLPLTRAMVEANRAKFVITSTPGEGTLVEIAFPPTRVLAD